MKRKAITLIDLAIQLAIYAILAALLIPVFMRARENSGRKNCQSNLKQIGLSFLQYAHDYNDKSPLVTTNQGWVGALEPYHLTNKIFQCPSEKSRGKENLTDYWFNRRLAGVELKKVANVSMTFLSGEGEPSDDPNISIQILPPRWIEKDDSPARRHLDGANYGFVDGHVKFFKPQTIVAPEKGKTAPSFLLR